ncbi:MAG: hypothetical protein ABW056_09300 [Thermoanaerobaculia bacterium]
MTASGRPTLDEARSRLRELGYLDAGVDRLLFRPVFEWRGGAFLMAILLGAFSAALAALAAVEASEPGFALSAAAAVSLLAHVFVADLLPAALLALALAAFASRARTPGVAATTAGMVSALLIFALWIGGTYSLAREVSARTLLWAIPIGVVALFLAAAVRLGFLALAFARAGKLPRRALRRVFAAAAALGLLVAILLLFSRRERPPAPSPQPSPRSAPVVVLAVDGLDLDGAGKNGPAAEVLAGGATGWWPAELGSPPEIWTTLATGVDPAFHRVRALTRVRPLGSPLSLRPPWGTGWYLRGIGPRLGLVANAPVSHSDRRSLDFWEVAASAGIPSLSVGWWAAGPWPGAVVVENREVFARAADGPGADREAIRVFESDSRKGFALSTVYLPGCDIAREDPAARAAAQERVAELLRVEVGRARAGEIVLVVLAADSHPRPAALGRLIVFDGAGASGGKSAESGSGQKSAGGGSGQKSARGGSGQKSVQVLPVDAAPSILARVGIPPARDLAGRPVASLFAPGTLETATVPSYGPRVAPPASTAPKGDQEYLEKLRSLGYLQ